MVLSSKPLADAAPALENVGAPDSPIVSDGGSKNSRDFVHLPPPPPPPVTAKLLSAMLTAWAPLLDDWTGPEKAGSLWAVRVAQVARGFLCGVSNL